MSIKDFFRKLFRIGAKAALETAVDQVEKGPITAGNVLKPAGKAAGKTIAKQAIKKVADKL